LGYPTEPSLDGGVDPTSPETPETPSEGEGGGGTILGRDLPDTATESVGMYEGIGMVRFDPTTNLYWYFDQNTGYWLTIGEEQLSQFPLMEYGGEDQNYLGGIEKQFIDGQWFWVTLDADGNPINYELVTEENMSEYEQAQYDLQQERLRMEQEQWAWEMANSGELSPLEQAQLEQMQAEGAARYSEPRDWIQRWTYDWMANSPERQALQDEQSELSKQLTQAKYQQALNEVQGLDTTESQALIEALTAELDRIQFDLDSVQAPNAPTPDFLTDYTGLQEGQPIAPGSTKMGSGQSLQQLQPSELAGVYGYVDWAAGRADTPYASGEDWMYESQKLLPKKAPKRAYSWSPR
jgi:hypothetical protein